MKSRFTKTIIGFMIFSVTFMLNGFCIFQFASSPFINTAQAAAIQDVSAPSENNIVDSISCGGDTGEESNSAPVSNTVDSQAQNKVGHPSNNAVLPCCVDGSHKGIEVIGVSESKKIEFAKVLTAVLPFQLQPIAKIDFTPHVYNQILIPPDLTIIKTKVLRL